MSAVNKVSVHLLCLFTVYLANVDYVAHIW